MSDPRCFHCGARTVAFQQAVAELAAVTQELHERDEQHRRVMDSPCPDEQHCTCVPILRAEIEQLEAENQKLRDTNQRLCERPQLRVNVEALVDDVERLSSELEALRQFVEKHSRGNSLHMDGTKNYRMGGYIGRARTLWDAINRSENKTEMGDE